MANDAVEQTSQKGRQARPATKEPAAKEAQQAREGCDQAPMCSPRRRGPVKRKTVINEATKVVFKRLKNEDPPSKETVGNLVQLLKAHKEVAEDEDKPREAKYVWPGLDDE